MVYKRKANPEHARFRTLKVWKDFRESFIKNHGGICELCGRQYPSKKLNVHHRYITNYEDLREERFMLLCPTCHDFVHTKCSAPNFKDKQWFGAIDEDSNECNSN